MRISGDTRNVISAWVYRNPFDCSTLPHPAGGFANHPRPTRRKALGTFSSQKKITVSRENRLTGSPASLKNLLTANNGSTQPWKGGIPCFDSFQHF